MPYDLSGLFPAIAKIAGKDKVTGGPAYEDVLDPQTGQVVRKWKMDPYQGSSGFLGIGSRNRAQALNDAIMPELAMQQQRIASANELEQRRIAAQKELANLEAANRMAELDTKNTYDTTGRNELAGLQKELEKLKSRLTVKEAAAKSDVQNIGKTGALINKRNKRQYGQADQNRIETANRMAELEKLAAMDSRMNTAFPNAVVAAQEAVPLKNAVTVNKGQSVFLPKTAADVIRNGSTITGAEEVETPMTFDAKGMPIFGGRRILPATFTDTTLSPDIAAAVMSQPQASAAQPVVEPAQPLFPLPSASAPLSFDPSLLGAMFNPQQQTAPIPAVQQNTNGVPVIPNTFTNAGWNNDPIARQAAAQAAAAQNRKALWDMLKRAGVDFVQRADDALFPNRIR